MFEVIITTKWPILIPCLFNGNLVFASLELLKFHHSFLFLSNILILFQSLICIKYFKVCFNVCPMKSLLCFLRCPFVSITLIRWVCLHMWSYGDSVVSISELEKFSFLIHKGPCSLGRAQENVVHLAIFCSVCLVEHFL